MLINRLSVLLAERNIKASRVSSETGIARSTLNSISKNESKMIQLETINNLCSYLKVKPDDFFLFTPINFNFDFQLPTTKELAVTIGNKGKPFIYLTDFEGDLTVSITKNYQKIAVLDLTFSVPDSKTFDDTEMPLFLDTYKMNINVNDSSSKEFEYFWNEQELYPFFQEAEKSMLNSFLTTWKNDKSIAKMFKETPLTSDNFEMNIHTPILPF